MIIAADSDFETNMTLSERLFALVGQFNAEVTKVVAQIVNDFSLPQSERQYHPQTYLNPKHAVILNSETHDERVELNPDQMIYLVDGALYKLCAYGQEVHPGSKPVANQVKPQLRKQFAREFNSVDLVSDSLLFISNIDTKYRLRTPLTTLVDYKGFRAAVTAELPIKPEKGLALGFDREGKL